MAQAKIKSRSSIQDQKLIIAEQINQRLREAGMLISFAVASYILVALYSYNAQDAAWSHSGTNNEIQNFAGVAGAWIADRLRMSHRVNASRAISRFRKGQEFATKKMKKKMLQCTG